MLISLLESLDQIVIEEAKSVLGVLKDLLTKLGGDRGEEVLRELKKFLRGETCCLLTVLQRLVRAGKYDWVNENITDENFPVPEDFVLGTDPKVFHFNRNISSEEAVKEMDKEGYRPATTWDLLDYGAKNPEEQRKFPIVGLDSVGKVSGYLRVPCLDRVDSERDLSLSWWDGEWDSRCRFLAVRKKVSRTSAP